MIVAMTGATGALGATTLTKILQQGHQVRALVRPRLDRELPQLDGVTWIEGSLDNVAALDHLVDDTDAILHLAYCPTTDPPTDGRSEGEHFIQTNIAGTVRLIERCPRTREKQLIYASSLSVYGTASFATPIAEHIPIDEEFPVWPEEFYAAHKAALEKMVIAGSRVFQLNASALRIGCVLSKTCTSESPLGTIVAEATTGTEIRTQMGAYVISADDTADIIVRAIGDPAMRGRVYNTFDAWLDFSELAHPLSDLLGKPVAVTSEEAPEPEPGIENYSLLDDRSPEFHTQEHILEILESIVRRPGPS